MNVTAIIDSLFPQLFRILVRQPERIEFRATHLKRESIVFVKAAKDDVSLIIGKGARTYRAIRHIGKLIGDRHRHEIMFEDVQGGSAMPVNASAPIESNVQLAYEPLAKLVIETVRSFSDGAQFRITKQAACYEVLAELTQAVSLETEAALNVIFGAAAKVRGGDMRVLLRSRTEGVTPLERQPETAAGRYSGEV